MNRPPFEKRVERIKHYLAERDLRAFIVLDELNTVYVSGYFIDISTWERPVATVIPRDEEPFQILNELSYNQMRYLQEQQITWIKDVRFYLEHPRQVNRLYAVRDWGRLLSEILEQRKIVRGRIGVDSKKEWLKEQIDPFLLELEIIDCDTLLRDMRNVKDEYELDLIRKSGDLTDWGQERFKEGIAVGKTALEIGAENAYIVTVEACKRYPDYGLEIWSGFTGTGPFAAMPHGMHFNTRKIQKGETLVNGVGACLNGYFTENERTFFTGPPTEKQRTFFEVMTEAQLAGVEQCVAGNRLSDIDAATVEIIEKAGYGQYIFHRTGHGIGLGGHEWPDDMAFNHLTLEPGMVLSVEPAIYVYGYGGFRHSDTVIVGKTKPEVVTKYTKELADLIVEV